jgi:hypothetical protein
LKKTSSAFLVVMMVGVLISGIAYFGTVQAESSIPKPSVPEFTVRYVDNSYYVPPRYDIDPYTGKNVIVEAGYYVQNKTIEVRIKNQPFNPYEDENGNYIRLYYSIRMKGHFGNSWWYPDHGSSRKVDSAGASVNYVGAYPDSENTVIEYGLVGNNGTTSLLNLDISAGGQADFQVEAFTGYSTAVEVPPDGTPWGIHPTYYYIFTGETSDWSETKTITIPASTSSPPDQTPTSTHDQENQQTDLSQIILAVALIVAVVCVGLGLLIYLIKRH